MCEIVRSYEGEGKFDHGFKSFDSKFLLFQYSDSSIVIECEHKDRWIEPGSKVSMEGVVIKPDGKIKVTLAYVQKIFDGSKIILKSFKPVEIIFKENNHEKLKIKAGMTNFIFGECEELSDSLYGFSVNIDSLDISFIQLNDYDEKLKKLEKKENRILVTSEVEVYLNKNELQKVKTIIMDMSYLLSYSCRTVISLIYEDYYSDQDLIKTILRPVLTKSYHNRDMLIDSDHLGHCALKDFLETTHSKYVEYKNKFGLNIVISFYLEAITFIYGDMGFLLSSTALESLLNGYAEFRKEEKSPITVGSLKRNEKKILEILEKENVETKDEIAKKISSAVSYQNLNVQEILSAFIKDSRFKMKLNQHDRDFSIIRNKISHTGKFPMIVKSNGNVREINLLEEHNRLIYLIDRIILKILGYEEKPFLNRGNDYKVELL